MTNSAEIDRYMGLALDALQATGGDGAEDIALQLRAHHREGLATDSRIHGFGGQRAREASHYLRTLAEQVMGGAHLASPIRPCRPHHMV